MKRRVFVYMVIALGTAAGCGCVGRVVQVDNVASQAYLGRPRLGESLFPSDQAVLSNEAIEQILSSRIVLPQTGRLAVLRFGWRPEVRWWSSESIVELHEEIVGGLLDTLEGSKRLLDASLLPSLLTPEKQTVAYLREAAARYQADLLLVYSATSGTHRRKKLLARDQAKAYCTVEAVLLDVRTGIVPFTSAVTESATTTRSQDDLSFSETVQRAQLEAFNRAIARIGEELVGFLDGLPPEATGDSP